MDRHWDDLYRGRSPEDLSWFELAPATLDAVMQASTVTDAVVDVGAGASTLVDHLLRAGYADVTLVDLADAALERTRRRLIDQADLVSFVTTDLRSWRPARQFDLWHDRATFHFMASEEDRVAYKSTLSVALRPGGRAVIAAFAETGPPQCAGLETQRYSVDSLAAEFADVLVCDECRAIEPQARADGGDPATDTRPYVMCVFHRPDSAS